MHPLRRLWQHAAGHRRRIVLAALSSVANTLLDIAPPLLIGLAVDVVVQREGSFLASFGIGSLRGQLWVLAGLTAAVWIFESLFEYLYQIAWRNLAQTVQHELRVDAFTHIVGLDMASFEDTSTGALMSVLNDDVNQLERFLDRGAHELLYVLTSTLVISGLFVVTIPTIAPFAVAPIPLIVWGSVRFQRRLEPLYRRVRDQVGVLNATLSGALGGIATIKAFTGERREVERVRATSADYVAANAAAIRPSSAFIPLIRMAILVAFLAILVLAGFRTLDGALEVGTYSVLVFIVQRLLWPLTTLGQTFDLYQRAMASTRRVLDLLADAPAITSGTATLPEPARGELALEGVAFAYPDGQRVADGLDLHVPAGQLHAVVGATGAGKSTLVKLLLRLHDPQEGVVRFDGVDVRTLDVGALRRHFGLVSQDVFLFHGTVRDNLTYGDPDADDERVEWAARAAEAHDFITALPDGYDTVVGERGQKLSGGQRQRIALARAILRDPTVLLLDEATSAVDNETEAAIQRSLAQVASGRTTVVIAHRLSTVVGADRIHVLEAGRVVEAGTHAELLATRGRYARLWEVQTGAAAGTAALPPAAR